MKAVARVIVGSVDLAGSSSAITRHVLKANLYFRVEYKSGTQAERAERAFCCQRECQRAGSVYVHSPPDPLLPSARMAQELGHWKEMTHCWILSIPCV